MFISFREIQQTCRADHASLTWREPRRFAAPAQENATAVEKVGAFSGFGKLSFMGDGIAVRTAIRFVLTGVGEKIPRLASGSIASAPISL
jgi:hypothetical protein